MKTLTLTCLCLLSTVTFAQSSARRFTIGLGSGIGTSAEMYESTNDLTNIVGAFLFNSNASISKSKLPLYIELHYSPVPRLELGTIAIRQKFQTEYFNPYSGRMEGNSDKIYNTLLFGLRYHYMKPSKFCSLYSGIYLGTEGYKQVGKTVAFSESSRLTNAAMQLDLLGTRLRVFKHMHAQISLGIGSRGIASAGLSYAF